jgi:hypothetical protein
MGKGIVLFSAVLFLLALKVKDEGTSKVYPLSADDAYKS